MPTKQSPQWYAQQGDILNVKADVLICSANVQLNLSDGVGGAILVRYGSAMQLELRHYLAEHQRVVVEPGTIVRTSSCGTPFRFVLHAVAVDAFYQTSHEKLVSILDRSLSLCAGEGVRSVALTALATGYGRLPMSEFADALNEIACNAYIPVETVVVGVRHRFDLEELLSSCQFPITIIQSDEEQTTTLY